MVLVDSEVYYYVGEKPPSLPCEYVDKNNNLIASIAGATLTARCSLDGGVEFPVTCTNTGDGTFTIDWPTGTSAFVAAGALRVDVEVVSGARLWYMPRFSILVRARA